MSLENFDEHDYTAFNSWPFFFSLKEKGKKKEGRGVKRQGLVSEVEKSYFAPPDFPSTNYQRQQDPACTRSIKHTALYGTDEISQDTPLHFGQPGEGETRVRTDRTFSRTVAPTCSTPSSSLRYSTPWLKTLTAPHTVCASLKEMTKAPDPIFFCSL